MFMTSQLSAPDRPANIVLKKSAKPELAFMDPFVSPHQAALAPASGEARGHHGVNIRDDWARRLRENLARKALHRFSSLLSYIEGLTQVLNETDMPSERLKMQTDLVTDHASNWPDHGLLRASGDGVMGTCVWLASVAGSITSSSPPTGRSGLGWLRRAISFSAAFFGPFLLAWNGNSRGACGSGMSSYRELQGMPRGTR